MDGGAAEPTQQPSPGGSAKDVIVTERYCTEGAPHEARTKIPDDRFDFGKLGHSAPEKYVGRYGFTTMLPTIVGCSEQW